MSQSLRQLVLLLLGLILCGSKTVRAENPHNDWESFASAKSYYAAQQWDEALAAFKHSLSKPLGLEQSAAARFFAAECELQLGKADLAAARYQELIEEQSAQPYRSYAYFRIGEAAWRAGNHKDAERNLVPFLEWQEVSVYTPYAWQILGELAADRGDWGRSKSCFQQLIQRYPQHPVANKARLGLSIALLELNQLDTAVSVAGPLAGGESETLASAALLVIARAHFALEEYGLVVSTVEELRTRFPNAAESHQGTVVAGWACWRQAQYDAILSLTTDADAKQPYFAELLALRGMAHYAQEDWGEASEALAQAAELLPERIHLSFFSGEALRRVGDRQRARAAFQRVVAVMSTEKPVLEDSWVDDALWSLAQMAAAEGDMLGSQKLTARIRKDYPQSPYAAAELVDQNSTQAELLVEALNHQRDARYDAALAAYQQLVDYCRNADRPAGVALFQQAKLHAKLDQHGAARKCYQECLKQGPASQHYQAAQFALGQLEQRLGREELAVVHFQDIIGEFPSSLTALEARYQLAKIVSTESLELLEAILATAVVEEDLSSSEVVRLAELRQHARESLLKGEAKLGAWTAVRQHAADQLTVVPEGPLRLSAEFWLAEAEYRLGNDAAAKVAFEQVDRRAHSSEAGWTAMAPLRLAQIAARRSQWLEVLKLLEGFRDQHPNFALLHEVDYLVGRALAGRGRMSAARSAYSQALNSPLAKGTETAARAQWMIGETFFHQTKYDLACEAYRKVIQEHTFPEWRVRAALQAGKCSELLGNWKQAQQFYETTIAQDSEIEACEELAARLQWTQRRLASKQISIK